MMNVWKMFQQEIFSFALEQASLRGDDATAESDKQ
jgi:hypothetical protein